MYILQYYAMKAAANLFALYIVVICRMHRVQASVEDFFLKILV